MESPCSQPSAQRSMCLRTHISLTSEGKWFVYSLIRACTGVAYSALSVGTVDLLVIDSATAEGVGAKAFATTIADKLEKIPMIEVSAWGDPAAGHRKDTNEQDTYARVLTREVSEILGIPVIFRPFPGASWNSIKLRVEASDTMLRTPAPKGNDIALMVDPACRDVISCYG